MADRLAPPALHQFAPVDVPPAVHSILDHWRRVCSAPRSKARIGTTFRRCATRIAAGRSPFAPDRRHFHHLLQVAMPRHSGLRLGIYLGLVAIPGSLAALNPEYVLAYPAGTLLMFLGIVLSARLAAAPRSASVTVRLGRRLFTENSNFINAKFFPKYWWVALCVERAPRGACPSRKRLRDKETAHQTERREGDLQGRSCRLPVSSLLLGLTQELCAKECAHCQTFDRSSLRVGAGPQPGASHSGMAEQMSLSLGPSWSSTAGATFGLLIREAARGPCSLGSAATLTRLSCPRPA